VSLDRKIDDGWRSADSLRIDILPIAPGGIQPHLRQKASPHGGRQSGDRMRKGTLAEHRAGLGDTAIGG